MALYAVSKLNVLFTLDGRDIISSEHFDYFNENDVFGFSDGLNLAVAFIKYD